MLVAGTREWGIMASLPFPFVIGLARPAVFHAGYVVVPEAVRVYLLAIFVK
jgi:hypothetical protein